MKYILPVLPLKRSVKLAVATFCIILTTVSFWVTVPAQAATGINQTINFQGKLVDNNGLKVADSTYSVVFTLYDASSGGTNLWDETQSVSTTDGLFQVELGSVDTSISSVDFNSDSLYLGIKVGADAEMTPRIRFASVPYAFNAQKVAGLTVTNTTGTLTIPNGKTISFGDSFTTSGANALTLTTTGTTDITLPTTGTLLTNTATANQSITSTQSLGTVFDIVDTTNSSGATTGLAITLSGAGAFDQTGLSFNLSGASGSNLNDIVGTGESWKVSRDGALTVASCNGCSTDYWRLTDGAISLKNDTLDFLYGSDATVSAKFRLSQSATDPTVQVSATTTYAGLAVNNAGSGDLFTASQSGASRFTVTNNGGIKLGVDEGDSGQCLKSGGIGGSAAWDDCNTPADLEVFGVYDSSGGDAISGTGITVNLDNVRKNNSTSNYVFGSDVLTINTAGTYMIQYRVSATLSSGTRGAVRAYLEEDTGSGFTEVPGTRAWAYGRITTYPEATAVGFAMMDVSAGTQLRLRVLEESGNFDTVADGSSLTVIRTDGVGAGGSGSGGGGGGSSVWSDLTDPTSSLTLNHGTNSTTFNSAVSGGDFFTLNGNSLTSGTLLNLASTATAMTDSIEKITLGGSSASNTGNLLLLNNTGTANANTTFQINHYATGTNNLAMRVNDESGDLTPFVIDGDGNVGIGTANPEANLELRKDAANASGPTLELANRGAATNTNGTAQINFSVDDSEGLIEPSAQIQAYNVNAINNDTDLLFSNYNGSSFAETMRIVGATGRVGIGISNPTAFLDVAGNASISGSMTFQDGASSIQTTSQSTLTLGGNTTGDLAFAPGGAQSLYLASDGTVHLSNVAYANCATLSTIANALQCSAVSGGDNYLRLSQGAFSLSNDTTDYLFGSDATASAKFRLTSSGTDATASVLGSTANAALLVNQNGVGDVFTASKSGLSLFTVTSTGGLRFGSDEGDSGQCLKSNGVGASVSWEDCGSGSSDNTQQYEVKTANQSVTNSTALVNDSDLSFTMGAGETWVFQFSLLASNNNSATPDWKAAVYAATASSCSVTQSGVEPVGTAFPQATTTNCTTPGTLVNNAINADANIPYQVTIQGVVTDNGTGGTVNLQFAENTAGAGTSSTIRAGSYVIAYKIGGGTGGGGGGGGSSSTAWSALTDPIGNLTLNNSIYTTTLNTSLTSGDFLTLNGDALTSGTVFNLASTATNMTGALEAITLSGNSSGNTGNLLQLNNTGTANANTSFLINHYATGTGNLALRVNDQSGDTTPFVIDGDGNVGIGTDTPTATLEVQGSSGTLPGARIAANTADAALIANNTGAGDLFVASQSGTKKFVVTNSGNVNLFGGAISDANGNVTINDALDVTGTLGLSTNSIMFSSTGGITFNGGTIADLMDEVDISDDLTVDGNVSLTGTTGLTFIGVGGDITFGNAERISNDTNGVITFGRNDAGTVTLNAADNDSTAALTINSGGAAALTLDTGGAAGVSIGTSNANAVTIGNGSASTALTGTTWSITSGGAATITSLTGAGLSTCNSSTQKLTWASGSFGCGTDATTDAFTVNTFTSNGTWNAPSGLKFAQVIVTGGGGGGGAARTTDTAAEAAAGGGGAGGTSLEMLTAATLGSSQTVTVGSAGTVGSGTTGSSGGNGGNSSFGSLTTANGGTGGTGLSTGSSTGANGGAGGTATATGDVNLKGGDGNDGGALAEFTLGGAGGSSYWGGGGAAGRSGGNAADAGSAGVAYGSGGGGAAAEDLTNQGADGGAGAGGVVVVMSYRSTGADLAEWYETKEDVSEGDVVAISPDSYEYESQLGLQKSSLLEKAGKDSSVVGIVSSVPFQTMGTDIFSNAKHPKPIALAGRVPVKVSDENGAVHAGDFLTISSTKGVAMKARTSGVTIGQALEDAQCHADTSCSVLVLVNTSYSSGTLLKGLFAEEGLTFNAIPEGVDVGSFVLGKLLQDKKDIRNLSTATEVSADHLIAGLEVISPKVVADEVSVNTLSAATQDNLAVLLGNDGKFVIKNASGSAVVQFDVLGNAFFAGTVTAGNFAIDAIPGIEMLVDEVEQQKGRVTSLETLFASSAASQNVHQPTDERSSTVHPLQTLFGLKVDGPATVSANFRVQGNSLVEGILNVVDVLTTRNLLVNNIADFFGSVIFHGDVAFRGKPTFNNDTAGTAVIKKGSDRVEVKFEKEFDEAPVVSANLILGQITKTPSQSDAELEEAQTSIERTILEEGMRYVVTRRTTKGFVIILKEPAAQELTFSWTALATENPSVTEGSTPARTSASDQKIDPPKQEDRIEPAVRAQEDEEAAQEGGENDDST